MSEFNAEELFDAIDQIVLDLLRRHNIEEPPVDALTLIQAEFHYAIRYVEEDEDDGRGRTGSRSRRSRPRELALRPDHTEAAQQNLAARACAKELVPKVLAKLGIVPGTEQRSAQNQLVGLIAPRLLLPSRWFDRDARKANFDLERLRERYSTAGFEMLALRLLDLDEPCVIAIVDDHIVTTRRGCWISASKTLTEAEKACIERVLEAREAQTVRREGWTARGWPIPSGPFNRIILRSVPDDL
jgi:predicted transcriptional regulator